MNSYKNKEKFDLNLLIYLLKFTFVFDKYQHFNKFNIIHILKILYIYLLIKDLI